MSSYYTEEARQQIEDGDIIAFRDTPHLMAWLIRLFTRSRYSHVGVAVWLHGRLLIVEARARGVVLHELSKRVRGSSASIEVRRIPDLDAAQRAEIAAEAVKFLDEGYDFIGLLRFAWGLMTDVPPVSDSRYVFCSELIDRALRAVDQVGFGRMTPDFTSPQHIIDGTTHLMSLKERKSRKQKLLKNYYVR